MNVGDHVMRLQSEEPRRAIVLEVVGKYACIGYEEGGEGWWPSDALRPEFSEDLTPNNEPT